MAKRKKQRFTAASMKKAKATKKPKKDSACSAPRCKVCGYKHWNKDPHTFPKDMIVLDDIKSKA